MKVFIYKGGLYCEACGKDIRKELHKTIGKPRRSADVDSDEYPAGPYDDGGGESDVPQHCEAGEKCILSMQVDKLGVRGGMFLANPLTEDGRRWVIAKHKARPTELTSFYIDFYSLEREL